MVPKRERMFSESIGMVSRVPGNIGMVPEREKGSESVSDGLGMVPRGPG